MQVTEKGFQSQRAFFEAKIAAGESASAAADGDLAQAQRSFAETFHQYFGVSCADLRSRKRILRCRQLISLSPTIHSWWLFGDGPEAAVGFSANLVAAAADFAICRTLSPMTDRPPTAVDRSIAAGLAVRLQTACAFGEAEAVAPELKSAIATIDAALMAKKAAAWKALSFFGAFPDGGELAAVVLRPDQRMRTKTPPETVPFASRNYAAVAKIPISADCFGGVGKAPLRRILALAPGDILPITWHGEAGASLMVGDRVFAKGALGELNGRRAIKLR